MRGGGGGGEAMTAERLRALMRICSLQYTCAAKRPGLEGL